MEVDILDLGDHDCHMHGNNLRVSVAAIGGAKWKLTLQILTRNIAPIGWER
jgi:hypothetical protein